MFLRILLSLLLAMAAVAETRMTIEQLRAFVRSSKKLGHSDKKLADFLHDVKLSYRLDERTIEELQGDGAGPRTVEALRVLAASSKSLPAEPAPEVKPAPQPIPPPGAAEQKTALDEARDYAREYTRSLPNFICTQVTRRYADPSGLEFWQRQDVITSKLTYFEQKEDYKVVLVNNRMVDTTFETLGGATSTGEFGSMLREVFAPETGARFEWERWATLRGRRMHVFAYQVTQPRSRWRISYMREREITPGYRGLVYVDKDTSAVMRLTLTADDIPPTFPVQQAMTTLDYDYVEIAGRQHVLPLKAVVRMRSGKLLTKNEVEFRMYRRFGAEATITFTPDPLSEEQTTEQPPK
ncbi:MAG: hypothetical protein HYZ57_12380 [Acidobacteria bacterium]|nr:hypothetical protein [Acidobacteriota bacterium]MBI3280627.1 hypothetical protein [Acidobacteriota bacterium]